MYVEVEVTSFLKRRVPRVEVHVAEALRENHVLRMRSPETSSSTILEKRQSREKRASRRD